MKAILVIEMPECCAECPLMLWDAESEYYGACCPTLKEVNCVADSYKENENKGTKPDWCPLRPMPMKRETQVHWKSIGGEVTTHEPSDYDKGWNDCVELLESEE